MISCLLICVGSIQLGSVEPDPPETTRKPYVEFDLSTLPFGGEGKYSFTLTVYTADKDFKWSEPAEHDRKLKPAGLCAAYRTFMETNRWKAQVVDKTKLRVYGRMFNDKLIPATKGIVTSPDLKKEQLPKVKNPPKA